MADIFAPTKENNTAQVWCIHKKWNSPGRFVVFTTWLSQPQDIQVCADSRWYWKQIQRGGATDFERQLRSCEGVWEYLQAKAELSEASTGGPWQGIHGLCDTADGGTQRKYKTGQERDPQRPGFGWEVQQNTGWKTLWLSVCKGTGKSAQTQQRMGQKITGSDQSHKFGDEKTPSSETEPACRETYLSW